MGRFLKVGLLIVVGAIIVLCAVGAFWLRNPDRFLPRVIADLQKKTGLQVEIKHVELRFLPRLTVLVEGLEVKNPKPFPAGDFLNVPTLEAAVEWTPLLHGKIVVRSLVLDRPTINFISDPDGLWNFQNPTGPKNQPEHFSMGSISTLEVKNGVLLGSNLIDPSDRPGPIVLELRGVSGDLKQIKFHAPGHPAEPQTIEGNLTAATAAFGSIHTKDLRSDVQITPRHLTFNNFETRTYRGKASGALSFGFAAKNTTFQAGVRVSGIGMPYLLTEFDQGPPKMTGMMQGKLDVAGEIAHTSSPLTNLHGTGNITVRRGQMPLLNQNASMKQVERFRTADASGLPASAFSTFAGDAEMRNQRIYSKQIGINFYGIEVNGSGSMSLTGGPMDYRGSATIEKKQGFFIDTFARWFKGAKEKDGRLRFPIRLTGTLAKPQFFVVH
ncbi:MAG TPA: AsmA family protein [Acidobacteriaceae bacterium]|nr:AsmA family protein [Terriglobia bacterium]HVC91312.1 AsmA family protein [Acidobacteriaceae bacterium]